MSADSSRTTSAQEPAGKFPELDLIEKTDRAMPSTVPTSLERVKVAGLPATAYYISDFISEDEEEFILGKVRSRDAIDGDCYSDEPSLMQPRVRLLLRRSQGGNTSHTGAFNHGPLIWCKISSSNRLSHRGLKSLLSLDCGRSPSRTPSRSIYSMPAPISDPIMFSSTNTLPAWASCLIR